MTFFDVNNQTVTDIKLISQYILSTAPKKPAPSIPFQLNPEIYFQQILILQKDAVYFEITGGGVTFGGGEPLLKAAFIKEYKECNPSISVAVETALNVDYDAVKSLADIVDYWIVDIKDMNDEIYFSYTGQSNARMIQNLVYLLKRNTQIRCRVPKIPEYNTDDDVQSSVAQLREMGVREIEVFEYEVR